MYESVCVPDLGDFLGYQGATHQVATPEHKSPATPASSTTSNSSGPQTGSQAAPTLQPPSGAVPLPSRQYHNDGKCLFSLSCEGWSEGCPTLPFNCAPRVDDPETALTTGIRLGGGAAGINWRNVLTRTRR